jgi:hypothetical protein
MATKEFAMHVLNAITSDPMLINLILWHAGAFVAGLGGLLTFLVGFRFYLWIIDLECVWGNEWFYFNLIPADRGCIMKPTLLGRIVLTIQSIDRFFWNVLGLCEDIYFATVYPLVFGAK